MLRPPHVAAQLGESWELLVAVLARQVGVGEVAPMVQGLHHCALFSLNLLIRLKTHVVRMLYALLTHVVRHLLVDASHVVLQGPNYTRTAYVRHA